MRVNNAKPAAAASADRMTTPAQPPRANASANSTCASHDDDIHGVSLRLDKPVDGVLVTKWLNDLLQEQGPDILRAKGILDVKGEERRLVFQAVHMILEGDFQREWRPGEERYSRMVFIGRDLNEGQLKAGFESCAA